MTVVTELVCDRCDRPTEKLIRGGLCPACYWTCCRNGTIIDWPHVRRPSGQTAEDVAWLHESGVPAHQWSSRIGRSARAIQRALYRAGRYDLTRLLGPEVYRERYGRD